MSAFTWPLDDARAGLADSEPQRLGATADSHTASFRELIADLETPVSTFLKIRQGDYSFLLESVEGGERLARYRCAVHTHTLDPS